MPWKNTSAAYAGWNNNLPNRRNHAMPQGNDKEPTIVTACMRADGTPTFAYQIVEVTAEEADNGVQYYLAEAQLLEEGYEEPFVHFAPRGSASLSS
jgi:hypothetical protein